MNLGSDELEIHTRTCQKYILSDDKLHIPEQKQICKIGE